MITHGLKMFYKDYKYFFFSPKTFSSLRRITYFMTKLLLTPSKFVISVNFQLVACDSLQTHIHWQMNFNSLKIQDFKKITCLKEFYMTLYRLLSYSRYCMFTYLHTYSRIKCQKKSQAPPYQWNHRHIDLFSLFFQIFHF